MAGSLLICALAFGQSRTIPPKDESASVPALAVFLKQFRETVRAQNTPALRAAISPTIQNDFGGNDGVEAFDRLWELDKPGTKLWSVLDRLLNLGGVLSAPDTYCAPSLAVKFPDDLDRYDHQVVAGTRVRLRAAPSANAAVLAQLSYEIVRELEAGPEWTRVRTLSGATGFVASAYLYSPLGYRACFVKNPSGAWQMTVLVAGD